MDVDRRLQNGHLALSNGGNRLRSGYSKASYQDATHPSHDSSGFPFPFPCSVDLRATGAFPAAEADGGAGFEFGGAVDDGRGILPPCLDPDPALELASRESKAFNARAL